MDAPQINPSNAPEIVANLRGLGLSVPEHIAAFRQSAAMMRDGFRSRAARAKWNKQADLCDALCDAMQAVLDKESHA